jgi:hypothetical protein
MTSVHDKAIAATVEKCRDNMKLDLTGKQVASIVKSYLKEVGANKPIGWYWELMLQGKVMKEGVIWGSKKPNLKDKVPGVYFEYMPLFALPTPDRTKGQA